MRLQNKIPYLMLGLEHVVKDKLRWFSPRRNVVGIDLKNNPE